MKRQRKRPADEPVLAIGSPLPGVNAKPPEGGAPNAQASRHWPCFFGLFLIAATFLAYLPALRGGFVWDDDSWTTRISGLLQGVSGLRAMWFHPTALQQYYPLSGTTFWLDHQLWKFWTPPYHVENVLLHALAALLFWRLLLRLQLPGAWLAAALFALHPVMVESAAWITERKNVLSLALYLGALLAYERFAPWVTNGQRPRTGIAALTPVPDPARRPRRAAFFYGLAFVLFLGALLAKTTTFSLPAAILLIGWWQRGQIRWRADVLPTLPFFALALGLCALTAWLEKNHVGAQGPDFALTFPQRCLVAGRAFWFYAGKLSWPAHLCFVYPRWQPNPGVWWQWLYPVTAVGTILGLWLARARLGRGPITALFFFAGTLFPVLGFMNAYFMRYSFVCDHWVYLPSLGLLALAAALGSRAAEQRRLRWMIYGFAVMVLAVLGILTWRQCGMYADVETLWQTTITRNPDCWLAHNNLGSVLFQKGNVEEGIAHFQKALQIKPDFAEAHNNLGLALFQKGSVDEGIAQYQKALQVNPDSVEAHNNLGLALFQKGKVGEAIAHYQRALEINPDFTEAHYNLGNALLQKGKVDEAIAHYQKALQITPGYAGAQVNLGNALLQKGSVDEAIAHYQRALQIKPDFAEAHYNLGLALFQKGNGAEAIAHYQKALQINPNYAEAHNNLGNALFQEGNANEAVAHFQKALEINPDYAEAHYNLGNALFQKGNGAEAIAHFQKALQINPDYADAMNNLACVLATCPQASLRNGKQAVELAQRANQLTGDGNPVLLGTLAAAYAEAGHFPEAVATAQRALQLAQKQSNTALTDALRSQLKLYQAGRPFRYTE